MTGYDGGPGAAHRTGREGATNHPPESEELRQARAAFVLAAAGIERESLGADVARFVDWLGGWDDWTIQRAAEFAQLAKGEPHAAMVETQSYREACPSCGTDEPRLYRLVPTAERPQFSTPEAAAEVFVPLLTGLDREHCLLASLDSRHRLIAVSQTSIGTIDHTFIAPREVLRDALLHGAAAVVVAHNHPSGDPDPSVADRLVTRRLSQAGALVGIDVLDHLIVGGRGWVSLARDGVI